LIKLLLSGKQILIVISLSLFIYIGYNVLTAEASEKEDKKVCEDYNGKWKETVIVDVDGNEKGSGDKQCQFDNDKDLKLYSIRPGYSLDGTGIDAEYGREDLGEEEAANIEDEICDNEDAKSTKISMCKEDKEEAQKVEDWRNTVDIDENFNHRVDPTHIEPVEDLQIPSTTTKYYDDEDREKQEKEIAEYNEEADEADAEDVPEQDNESNEEEEEQDEDESDDEEESNDSGDSEDSSESEE
jgi:hypothetical protein